MQCRAAASPSYGLFVCSGAPEVAEAIAAAEVDWMCLDAQHGAVPYDKLKFLICAAGGRSKKIVRVGGPTDRFGIQQALE
jgi:2-keto-3-deoxy-L-rhamnonate aldolase RhmA